MVQYILARMNLPPKGREYFIFTKYNINVYFLKISMWINILFPVILTFLNQKM